MLWWEKLVIWEKECAWSSWGYAWTRHGKGEGGGMAAEGAGDSLALLHVQ